MEPIIIFEDPYLLVIGKPAGLSTESGTASHPSAERWGVQYLAQQKQEKTGKNVPNQPYLRAAHRLDRPASGILVFAKTKSALTHLMGQFERREPEKTYWAATVQAPPYPNGTLTHWTKKDDSGKKALIFERDLPDTQMCSLSYKTIKTAVKNPFEGLDILPENLLEITLHTGRFHQIRAQFAHIGCPIIGDTQYGGPEWKPHAIQLCAICLKFRHPKSGEEMVVFGNELRSGEQQLLL